MKRVGRGLHGFLRGRGFNSLFGIFISFIHISTAVHKTISVIVLSYIHYISRNSPADIYLSYDETVFPGVRLENCYELHGKDSVHEQILLQFKTQRLGRLRG